MGLLLTGGIIITFYILKLVCPQFIVGVAELPSIVKLGTFIDTHIWATHLFNILNGFLLGYFYTCACTRKPKINLYENAILFGINILLTLTMQFLPLFYSAINFTTLIFLPFLCGFVTKTISKEMFVSTTICFCVDTLSQILSILIRDITQMSTRLNCATFSILLIDMYIWKVLLYLLFNYKEKEN